MTEANVWIFTTKGFISIVRSDQESPEKVMVRCRTRADAEHFNKEMFGEGVIVTEDSDYRFRFICRDVDASTYIKDCIEDIDYTNFKNAVEDRKRMPALHRVWHAMYELQETTNG